MAAAGAAGGNLDKGERGSEELILPDFPDLRSFLFDSPVGLVVVRHGGRTEAVATASFSEAAHHPTAMWISVAQASRIHELLMEAGGFTFVTLHRGQAGIAGVEAGGLESFERDALASVACRITRSEPVGDHTLFVAEMMEGVTHSRCSVMRPLLLSDLRSR